MTQPSVSLEMSIKPAGSFVANCAESFMSQLGEVAASLSQEESVELLEFISQIRRNPYEPDKVIARCVRISADNSSRFEAYSPSKTCTVTWNVKLKNVPGGRAWTITFLKVRRVTG